jgi:D-glycero-D-manno-heptose 1,7-bisphosphate phosphatase
MNAAAFLDRDGTLIVEREYLADPDDVEFAPGAFEALHTLRDAGYALVLVTNQSGIARGIFSEQDFHAVQRRVTAVLRSAALRLDATYWCPHHPDFSGPCDCRKPLTGMYRRAAAELDLDLTASVYIGDRLRDVLPALELGGSGILLRTGYGREEARSAPPQIRVVDDLPAAAALAAALVRPDPLDSVS